MIFQLDVKKTSYLHNTDKYQIDTLVNLGFTFEETANALTTNTIMTISEKPTYEILEIEELTALAQTLDADLLVGLNPDEDSEYTYQIMIQYED